MVKCVPHTTTATHQTKALEALAQSTKEEVAAAAEKAARATSYALDLVSVALGKASADGIRKVRQKLHRPSQREETMLAVLAAAGQVAQATCWGARPSIKSLAALMRHPTTTTLRAAVPTLLRGTTVALAGAFVDATSGVARVILQVAMVLLLGHRRGGGAVNGGQPGITAYLAALTS